MQNILVTGGAGYIGSHTVVKLCEMGFNPIIVDDFRCAKKTVVERINSICGKKLPLYQIDCGDYKSLKSVFIENKIDGIIHFAAYKAVGESVENPLKYFENNLVNLITLLKIQKEFGVKKMVFSSSCTVYGSPAQTPVYEDSQTSFQSPYGFTKLANEQMIQQFSNSQNDFQFALLRYFNPIGAHPSGLIGEDPQGIPSNLLPYITQTAKGIRPFLTIYGNDYDTPDGTCIRDYIHIMDLADAHVFALKYLFGTEDNICNVFNIGTGRGTSVIELIDYFEKNCAPVKYKIGPRRAGDVAQIFADIKKSEQILGWKSKYSIEEAVKSAWNFELNNDSNP
jgi:UDP-glucose 4-epimerase